MKTTLTKGLGLTVALVLATQVYALPETPAIKRDVHMTEDLTAGDPQYTRPTIPSFPTSADGRVALIT